MGKLGGAELNYSSDVDIVFVHGGAGGGAHETASNAAAAVIAVLTEPTAEGIALRAARAIVVGRVGAHVGASGPLLAQRDAGPQSLIDKATVSIIAVQPRGNAVAADEEIRPPVHVVVEDDDVHRLRRLVQAGRGGHILEPARATIAIQLRRDRLVRVRPAVALHSFLRTRDFNVRRPLHVMADE